MAAGYESKQHPTVLPSLFQLNTMKPSAQSELQEAGFTRLDLLVLLVMLAILIVMLLPALARTKSDSRAFQCLNKQRELSRAWWMWSNDNNENLLMAGESATGLGTTWVTGLLDNNPNNQSNWNPATDIHKSPLWSYSGTNAGIWRCPADTSYVIVNGTRRPRVRSYVMNWYFSDWVNIVPNGSAYAFFRKSSDMAALKPSQLLLLLDLRPDTVAGGEFAISMAGYPSTPNSHTFLDLPGVFHDNGAGIAYADGSGEIHRWRDPRTLPPLSVDGSITDSFASPRNPDIAWLQERATRPK
jgi:prepilin-type processing-associated H-X9-DG protein